MKLFGKDHTMLWGNHLHPNWPGERRLTVVGGQLKFYMTYPLVAENELIFIMDRVGIVDSIPTKKVITQPN